MNYNEIRQALLDAQERVERDRATAQPVLMLTCDICCHMAITTHLNNLCTHLRAPRRRNRSQIDQHQRRQQRPQCQRRRIPTAPHVHHGSP
jgi:hypothetical protein